MYVTELLGHTSVCHCCSPAHYSDDNLWVASFKGEAGVTCWSPSGERIREVFISPPPPPPPASLDDSTCARIGS